MIPHFSLIGIDLIIIDVEYLSMCFYYFTPSEYNLPLESGFLKLGPFWNLEFFSDDLPQHISSGQVSFKALLDLLLLEALWHLF